jgi:hypothetical protein
MDIGPRECGRVRRKRYSHLIVSCFESTRINAELNPIIADAAVAQFAAVQGNTYRE